MKIQVKKIGKNAVHLVKCEENGKKRVKLGSFSRQGDHFYFYLDFRRFFYYLRGGASFEKNRTYVRSLGNFDFFWPIYQYESKKNSKKAS